MSVRKLLGTIRKTQDVPAKSVVINVDFKGILLNIALIRPIGRIEHTSADVSPEISKYADLNYLLNGGGTDLAEKTQLDSGHIVAFAKTHIRSPKWNPLTIN
jgi:hypothetical protein